MTTLGEIWAVSLVAGPLDIRILIPGVPAFKMTVTSTPRMIVTPGAPDAIIITNLSLSPIEIGNDRSLAYGQGTPIPAKSQWSPLTGIQSIWGSPHYYDRNPLSVGLDTSTNAQQGSGTFALWLYTVPAGRRAYLEAVYVEVTIRVAYSPQTPLNIDFHLDTHITLLNAAGAVNVATADIVQSITLGTTARVALGTSMELQPGESARAEAFDGRTDLPAIGWAYHRASAKVTEFDLG